MKYFVHVRYGCDVSFALSCMMECYKGLQRLDIFTALLCHSLNNECKIRQIILKVCQAISVKWKSVLDSTQYSWIS